MTSFRAGFVALLGEPNAGKSTLINTLIGEKVSIVSPKPQTTRQRITGILTTPTSQMVFVDAPGTLNSTSGLNSFLQDEVKDVVAQADVILLLLPADATEAAAEAGLELLTLSKTPAKVVITKNDLLGGTQTPRFFRLLIDKKVSFFSISSQSRPEEARAEILNAIEPLLPEAKAPLFDGELYTTQTVRQMAAEIIREQCFENLHQEIPYALAVLVREFKEGPTIKISAEIIVDKDNHKGIVIGAKGASLKTIGTAARLEIEKLVGQKVFLELHVAVKQNWTKNRNLMKELGYVTGK
jgi:GTP-binding protein Era